MTGALLPRIIMPKRTRPSGRAPGCERVAKTGETKRRRAPLRSAARRSRQGRCGGWASSSWTFGSFGLRAATRLYVETAFAAVERNLFVIGEAAKDLPDDLLALAPEVDWRAVKNLTFAAYFLTAPDTLRRQTEPATSARRGEPRAAPVECPL